MTGLNKVAVIDTGAGNLFSLFACLKRIGFEAELIRSAKAIADQNFRALIIPGQGRFGAVMQQLNRNGLADVIKAWFEDEMPIIGICVGMQIFFESSEEDKNVAGLALLDGQVSKLNSPKQPMVGWCSLNANDATLNDRDVYFVNSYAAKGSEYATSWAEYGEKFVASISTKGLDAFQFHPEKSGVQGEEILKLCLK
ncbi:MAG: imidazole glycerol phosphate synthase subunit HisH [Gammaproteobacteria bacterium]|nr:imidazole glycerol phosphate synthase subunit HisH [Gammaproteobacteria bacterium]